MTSMVAQAALFKISVKKEWFFKKKLQIAMDFWNRRYKSHLLSEDKIHIWKSILQIDFENRFCKVHLQIDSA